MEWRDVALAVLGLITTVFGWLARTLWSEVRRNGSRIGALETHVAESYVRRDDYREDMGYIKSRLDVIVDRLPSKE